MPFSGLMPRLVNPIFYTAKPKKTSKVTVATKTSATPKTKAERRLGNAKAISKLLQADRDAGMTLKEVAAKYGVSITAVVNNTLNEKVKIKNLSQLMQADRDKGMRIKDVAKKYGVSKWSVERHTKKALMPPIVPHHVLYNRLILGDGISQVARDYDVSLGAIHNHMMRDYGTRVKRQFIKEYRKKHADLLLKGM